MAGVIRAPFLEIGPKNYLYGEEVLQLALAVDAAAEKNGIDIFFTCPYIDLRRVCENTKHIHVLAPHMDSLRPGRGIAEILPEAVADAGAEGVMLNHAEKRLNYTELESIMQRAKELGLLTVVCADSMAEIRAVAMLGPDVIVAEPEELIGKCTGGDISYVGEAVRTVKEIDPGIQVLVGAGIRNGKDVYDVILAGSDASGSSSAVVLAEDRAAMVEEMAEAAVRAWNERKTFRMHTAAETA
ncbi:MAG: triose-phosphate isomerase [Clostridiales bacterium]|nr:triose-phosphate isomerase [Clostridiales bacterium]